MRRWIFAIGDKWSEDDVPRLAAATSFYTLLSLAPLLVVAVAIAAQIFGSEGVAKTELLGVFRHSAGPQVAEFLNTVIDNSHKVQASLTATIISLTISVWSGSGLFMQIHQSMHDIWDLKIEGHVVRRFVWSRLAAIVALAGFGIVLVAWLVLESFIATFASESWGWHAGRTLSFFVGLGFFTTAFAAVFHSMPPGQTRWKDVVPGAFVSALGLVLSRFVLGIYFSVIKISAAYGSAGVIVVLLFWIYYVAMMFYLGAQIVYLTTHRERLIERGDNMVQKDEP